VVRACNRLFPNSFYYWPESPCWCTPSNALRRSPDQADHWAKLAAQFGTGGLAVQTTTGGGTRFHSVQNGLAVVNAELVAIHDAVRPLVSTTTISRCFGAAAAHSSGIPVIPLTDSIRRIEADMSVAADRAHFRLVQTPQCFSTALLREAYTQPFRDSFTDDASVVEALVEGNPENIKLTTPADLVVAAALLNLVE
jgi:2-C-methyl-D-erythritol 4-phosphate cytidylyltransferase